jgi:hypothetical protein
MKRDLYRKEEKSEKGETTLTTVDVQCSGVSDPGWTRSSGVAIRMVCDVRVVGVHGTLLEDIKRRRHISYCLIGQGSCRKERS